MKSKVFMNKRTKGMLVVLALFVCTSFCLGDPIEISDDIGIGDRYPTIAGNGDPENNGKVPEGGWKDPTGRTLIINQGAKVGDAYGAYMDAASVSGEGRGDFRLMTNNKLIVNGGDFTEDNDIAGAYAFYGYRDIGLVNIASNTVTIKGGKGIGAVFGGSTGNGTVSSNTVTISSDVTIKNGVFGGFSENGNAIKNIVDISGGAKIIGVGDRNGVYGGVSFNGNVKENEVKLTNVSVSSSVYGGYVLDNGDAIDNKVELTDVDVRNNVYGAWIDKNGLASSNTVTIISGTVKQNVYGGYIGKNGTATLNTVNLTGVTVSSDVYGAWIGVKYVVENGLASNNIVTITGGKVEGDVLGGRIMRGKGTATGNTVKLTDVDVTHDVYGARIGTSKRVVDEERAKAKAERTKALENAKEAGRVMNSIGYKRIIIDAAFKAEKAKVSGMVVNRDETEEVKKAKLEEVFGAKMEADYEAAKDKLVGEQEAKLVDFRTKAEGEVGVEVEAKYAELLEELQTEYFKFSKVF